MDLPTWVSQVKVPKNAEIFDFTQKDLVFYTKTYDFLNKKKQNTNPKLLPSSPIVVPFTWNKNKGLTGQRGSSPLPLP